MNLKTKNWKDLLTDEPFARKDLITLQDPTNTDKNNLNNFHHLKNSLKVDNDGKRFCCIFNNPSFQFEFYFFQSLRKPRPTPAPASRT